MLKKQVSPKIVAIVFAVIVVCFAIAVYVSAWTEPSAVPPGANVAAPLNVSNTGQTKTGALRLGGLTVDNDSYLATVAGNVGIGTTGPGAMLHVSGGNVLVNNTFGYHIKDAAGTARWALRVQAGDDLEIGDTGFDDITFTTGSLANAMVIKDTSGNVGIGTASPGYKLDVNGDINIPATGFLRIASNAGSSGQVLTRTDTGMAWQAGAAGGGFGSLEAKSNNTVYKAATDGFVFAYSSVSQTVDIRCVYDSFNPPTTIRQRAYSASGSGQQVILNITCAVEKNYYWRVTGASTVYWQPLQ